MLRSQPERPFNYCSVCWSLKSLQNLCSHQEVYGLVIVVCTCCNLIVLSHSETTLPAPWLDFPFSHITPMLSKSRPHSTACSPSYRRQSIYCFKNSHPLYGQPLAIERRALIGWNIQPNGHPNSRLPFAIEWRALIGWHNNCCLLSQKYDAFEAPLMAHPECKFAQ